MIIYIMELINISFCREDLHCKANKQPIENYFHHFFFQSLHTRKILALTTRSVQQAKTACVTGVLTGSLQLWSNLFQKILKEPALTPGAELAIES